MSKIAQALSRTFEKHRIVFWYDHKRELRDAYEALSLEGVEKIELHNNQFGIKHRILRQEPDQQFLLYHEGPPPSDLDNWLLDVELAHGTFRADQTALWLSELGLGIEFTDIIEPHAAFLKAAQRRASLQALLKPDDTPGQVRLKMLAVCASAEPRIDDVLENLLAELAAGKEDKINLIERCALDAFLWKQLERFYGYHTESPSLPDFAIELFKSCYALSMDEPAQLNTDALVFLNRWKDSVRHHEAFEALSAEYASILNIEHDLQQRDYQRLVDLDTFELIDCKILSELVHAVAQRTLSSGACSQFIRQRRQRHWYTKYEHPYEAIDVAAHFLETLDKASLTVQSMADGLKQYSTTWYVLDQQYRQFCYHVRRSGQATLLAPLIEQVENHYTNQYLLKLGDAWQAVVDAATTWAAPPFFRQQDFFAQWVRPFLMKDNKIYVVISDGLRYEAAEALLRRIRQEDRYEATIEPALSVLPSYTQLGMAALLPHKTLGFSDGTSLQVMVDDMKTQGTPARKKVLEQALPGRATALQAEEFREMNREESRALTRDHEIVYIYHNRIDATGDKRDSEDRVFEAVEETLDELVLIIKKLTGANASNIIVTADHGFIYQDRALDESDFVSQNPGGSHIALRNRRFVLGTGLVDAPSFKHLKADTVGLVGDVEMLFPKSIGRLRVKGAGSRYVHGGTSLQEVVVPVLQINKKRESDVTQVDVDILRGSTNIITAGQHTVVFYQTTAVTDKVQPRLLRAGIYTQDGVLISDVHELRFDIDAEHPRDREMRVRFVLTRHADQANNQEVVLRLDEQVGDTSHYREYKAARYILRRSFTSDFDF